MPAFTIKLSFMPGYIQNQPAGAKTVQPNFQLKEDGGAVPEIVDQPLLGFVLDRSGSMSALAENAIAGFDALLSEQKKINPQTLFCLSIFDHEIISIHDAMPLIDVPNLGSEIYVPRGATALNDAIGAMIQQIGRRAKRLTRVLIAILTDGEENSSRQFSRDDIMRMVTYRRTTYDWQFIFIGPKDALEYALSIGIPRSNVVGFDLNPEGMQKVMQRLSKSMAAYQLGDRRYALKLRY
jgi:uncharacterized protein YegL